MNTNTFTSFFSTKESYKSFEAKWKERAAARALTRGDMALRAIMLDRDIFKTFKPKTNKVALANGYAPYSMLKNALYEINGSWLMSQYPELKDSDYLKAHLENIRAELRTKGA